MAGISGLQIFQANLALLAEVKENENLIANKSFALFSGDTYFAWASNESRVLPAVKWTLKKLKWLKTYQPANYAETQFVAGVKDCSYMIYNGVYRLAESYLVKKQEENRTQLLSYLDKYQDKPQAPPLPLPKMPTQAARNVSQEAENVTDIKDPLVSELEKRMKIRQEKKEAEIQKPKFPITGREFRKQKSELKKFDTFKEKIAERRNQLEDSVVEDSLETVEEEINSILKDLEQNTQNQEGQEKFDAINVDQKALLQQLEQNVENMVRKFKFEGETDLTRSFIIEEKTNDPESN